MAGDRGRRRLVSAAQRRCQRGIYRRSFRRNQEHPPSSSPLAQIPTWHPAIRPWPFPILNHLSRCCGVCKHRSRGPQQTKAWILEAAALSCFPLQAVRKCKRPPEFPRPLARAGSTAPHQGRPYYRGNTAANQVTLRRVAPWLADPPLVPETDPANVSHLCSRIQFYVIMLK